MGSPWGQGSAGKKWTIKELAVCSRMKWGVDEKAGMEYKESFSSSGSVTVAAREREAERRRVCGCCAKCSGKE